MTGNITMHVTYKYFKYRMVITWPSKGFDTVTHVGWQYRTYHRYANRRFSCEWSVSWCVIKVIHSCEALWCTELCERPHHMQTMQKVATTDHLVWWQTPSTQSERLGLRETSACLWQCKGQSSEWPISKQTSSSGHLANWLRNNRSKTKWRSPLESSVSFPRI